MKKIVLAICLAAIATTLSAQDPSPKLYSFYFNGSQLNAVLDRLQAVTGKDITVDLGLSATITVNRTQNLTADEAAAVIVQALQEEGLRVENLDENTLRVRGIPKPELKPTSVISDKTVEIMKQREAFETNGKPSTYAERREQRMQNRQKPAESSPPAKDNEQLEKQLQAYQMEVIREGLTPENTPALDSESVPIPAEAIEEELSPQADHNGTN